MPGKTLKRYTSAQVLETPLTEILTEQSSESELTPSDIDINPIGQETGMPHEDRFRAAAPLTEVEDVPAVDATVKTIAKYAFPGLREISVTDLKFDEQQQWGQVRRRDPDHVKQLQRDLEANNPRTRIEILVRDMGDGMLQLLRRFGVTS